MQHAQEIVAIGLPFVWCGLVLGISFIETPLKFRAPGITLPLGLGIGRLVFRALNAGELAIACVLLIVVARQAARWQLVMLAALVALLLLQSLWLRPRLDRRTLRLIAGEALPSSSLHLIYIVLEAVKLIALPALGVALADRFIT